MNNIIVTGGAGYIGSHAVRELHQSGYLPVVLDDLSEGHSAAVLNGIFEEGSISDEKFLEDVFRKYKPEGVMHFASRCYVGESVVNPRRYFEENVGNALTLFRVMLRHEVKRFVFSSTCATYGDPVRIPMDEEHPQAPISPYGESKYFIERILRQYHRAYGFKFVSLRYFNASGASLDGRIGESHDPETHLIPLILMVAKGKLDSIQVFGNDYPTNDGTCIRDYIHVVDLSLAHLAALKWLESGGDSDFFNLGSGNGFSVCQVVEAAERITGKRISVEVTSRRPGDPPRLIADPGKASRVLNWRVQYSDLETILETAWKWENNRTF